MAKQIKEERKEISECPLCTLFTIGSRVFGKESEFYRHMINARIEFLQAIKSLIDSRIESLEKTEKTPKKKKFTKIEVKE